MRALILCIALLASGAARQAGTVTVEEEVRANVLRQPLGAGTVADLALPDEFLTRLTDRIVRSSFRERYHRVVPDPPGAHEPVSETPGWVWGAGYGVLTLLLALGLARRAARKNA